MVSPIRQRGMSGLSLLVVLLLIGFFATVLVKLLPIYMESWTIKGAINGAIEDGGQGLSAADIRKSLDRQFTVNQVTAIAVKDIEIKREKNGKMTINANYEKRVPFMQNVDVVVKFEKFIFEVQGK
ncbi:DUF4845 domain-containing protein [Dasania sp. GY-MA-18]|uniref:DUF4845 domain-containing protein n=1 Tax=Dasania phycosphaerae TaxID=2950436 RepID=A0A9J6RLZ7_9GAMM|nr:MULTISPECIES: DUF4845 domain-containing protein [Dasania]MCR8923310.1 DUF4845 domain-containing protein [Dasania sp. GY-MA-18]MCZ0865742.1 DUF4845 domain-containing protein [Dasania phycosphaerae]MCZ0869467.1 DUF4845 domain-containing protein [Dasania phycosphaerae]